MGKRKQYVKGFAWGKREHRFEGWMTKLLLLAMFGMGVSLLIHWDLLRAIVLGLLTIVLMLRLMTAFAHGREKHYMDSLRPWSRK
jgi:hypothetical protein